MSVKFDGRKAFVSRGLEKVLDNDRYSHFFRNEDGSELEEREYRDRKSLLEDSLNHTYDSMVEDKLKRKSLAQRLVATPLRYIAGGLYGLGTATFIALPGPVGFGFSGAGAGVSALADAIDSHYYHKAGLIKGIGSVEDTKLAGESLATKALGYFPVGTGLLDLYRGRRKFESKAVDTMVKDDTVVDYAISGFAKKLREREENMRIIPLSSLRDMRYAKAA